jgi:hypothetical protein
MIPATVALMEVFFEHYCESPGGTPDCRNCEWNIFKRGCVNPENPINLGEGTNS